MMRADEVKALNTCQKNLDKRIKDTQIFDVRNFDDLFLSGKR